MSLDIETPGSVVEELSERIRASCFNPYFS